MSDIKWHALSFNETLNNLVTNLHDGLLADEVSRRQKIYHPNEMADYKGDSILRRFLRQFHNSLIYILIVSALITIYLNQWVDASVIVGVIFGIEIIQKICMQFNMTFYSLSFNEGIELNILEIDSSESLLILEENLNLKSKIYIKEDNTFYYKLGFQDKKSLDELLKNIDKNNNIEKINIEYIN